MRTGYTTIVAANSGKCLDIALSSTVSGAPANQRPCTFAGNQQWTVSAATQGFQYDFKIIEQQTGQCLDVYQGSNSSGALIVEDNCGTSASQLWTFTPSGSYFQLVNQKSGMCANVSGASTVDGTIIVQSACSTASNFLWKFSTGLITNSSLTLLQAAHSGQCMGIYGNSTQAGAPIIQYPCDTTPDKQWYLYPYNNSYLVASARSAMCVSASGSGTSATIVQNVCTLDPSQLWNFTAVGGSYQLSAQNGGLCLAVSGASQAPLGSLGLATCAAAKDELWSLSSPVVPSSWSSLVMLPVDPVGIANLPNGTLMTWSSFAPDNYEGDIQNNVSQTYTSIFDPISLNSTEVVVTNTGDDMFCPGTANLADGRIMVNGGSSSTKTGIYNPATNAWSLDANMYYPRGYEGDTPLSNGSVLTMGGSWSGSNGGKPGEVWTSGSGWSPLTNVPDGPVTGPDPLGVFRGDNHLWLFAAPNGEVFQAGPSAQMNWITTSGVGTINSAGNRGDDPYSINGNAALYDVGMIMKAGGAPAYDGGTAEAAAYTININNGVNGVVVNKIAPMAYPRGFSNSAILPNGQVVIIGGQTYTATFTDSNAILIPEIWDPLTQVFRQLNPMINPRNYHSTAILLQDGRVFSGGGGLCGSGCSANHLDTQILTPPYLLNADGSAAKRPTISQAPTTGSPGGTLSVTTASPVVSFVLMRLSSNTHSVNNDQRRIPLQMASTNGTMYTLSIPSNPGIVLPGNYWLFALNDQGVPSVGSTILIH